MGWFDINLLYFDELLYCGEVTLIVVIIFVLIKMVLVLVQGLFFLL